MRLPFVPFRSSTLRPVSEVSLFWTVWPSPVGDLMLVGSEIGLMSISWDIDDPASHSVDLATSRESDAVHDGAAFDEVISQLDGWFSGRRTGFEVRLDPDPRVGSSFGARALAETSRIPYGQTRTYGEIATLAGSPGGARAAGQAVGRNPLPIVIPCHRVLSANGAIGGFSGGLSRKRLLLDLERR